MAEAYKSGISLSARPKEASSSGVRFPPRGCWYKPARGRFFSPRVLGHVEEGGATAERTALVEEDALDVGVLLDHSAKQPKARASGVGVGGRRPGVRQRSYASLAASDAGNGRLHAEEGRLASLLASLELLSRLQAVAIGL